MTPQQHFDKWAPEMEKLLAPEGYFTVDDVKRGWWEGRYEFWFGDDCFLVTEVLTFPQMKVGHCWMAGGDSEQLARLTDYLEPFYRAHGCKKAIFTGRKGWERHELTKSRGYSPTGTMFSKDL